MGSIRLKLGAIVASSSGRLLKSGTGLEVLL